MIRPSDSLRRDNLSGEGAKSPLHPVADDRAADFPGDGEANAHAQIRILAVADEQDEAGCRCAQLVVRGEEVAALLEDG